MYGRRGLSEFVGRESELEVLERALAQAKGGRGRVVSIVGAIARRMSLSPLKAERRTTGVLDPGAVRYRCAKVTKLR
jgi:hypothetical protein